jgi:hypothetical protein
VESRPVVTSSLKIVGRAFPMENSSYRDNAKARAMRDIQLAHSKDVHGNWSVCFWMSTETGSFVFGFPWKLVRSFLDFHGNLFVRF